MSSEENKALIRRYLEEMFDHGKIELAAELFAADYTGHGPGGSFGITEVAQAIANARNSYPDFHTTIDELLADNDKVVARVATHGTPNGSGSQLAATRIIIFRVANNRIEESWAEGQQLRG